MQLLYPELALKKDFWGAQCFRCGDTKCNFCWRKSSRRVGGYCGTVRTRKGKSRRNAVAVQTEDKTYWCAADRGQPFSVRTMSVMNPVVVLLSFHQVCFYE